jgi:hypothetical protein
MTPMKELSTILILTVLAACTSAAQYRRSDGGTNVIVGCGAAVGWNICAERAKEECPSGFDVLSQVNDGNRKEMTVMCGGHTPDAVSPAVRAAAACRMRVRETSGVISDAERRDRVNDCILAAGYVPAAK